MRYIHFFGNNGYCGTDYHEFRVFEDKVSDNEINEISTDMAYDNAATYSYLATGWANDFESEEEADEYYEDAYGNCSWEELSKQEWEDFKEDYE